MRMTDVTGFGLAGHLLEICRGSKLRRSVEFAELPLIAEAVELVQAGHCRPARRRATGAATARMSSCRPARDEWQQKLLTDPQTSGGLLVACAPECGDAVLAEFRARRLRRGGRDRAAGSGAGARLQVILSSGLQRRARRCRGSSAARRRSGCRPSGWKASRRSAKPSSRKGSSAILSLARQIGDRSARMPRVVGAVVGRQLACRPAARAPCVSWRQPDHGARLSRICATGRPRRPSLAPSAMITTAGLDCVERRGEAAAPAGGGFAADAGVGDAVVEPLFAAGAVRAAPASSG